MGIRTRSTTTSPVKPTATPPSSVEQKVPLRLFILPRPNSNIARFLLLDHPRDKDKRRFFFCPQKGLYSFTKITSPSIDLRSIIFAAPKNAEQNPTTEASRVGLSDEIEPSQAIETNVADGYVNRSAEFYVATPFDIAFVLLPLVVRTKAVTGKTLFQPLDDILEEHLRKDKHLHYIFQQDRPFIESAMERFCDLIDAGGEKMYRYREGKLLMNILERAGRVVSKGLPASLEEKFVTRELERPVLSIRREKTSTVEIVEEDPSADSESMSESFGSQSAAASSAASVLFSETSSISTNATVIEETVPPEVRYLQSLQTALDFITSSYVPVDICSRLNAMLESKQSPVNFQPLKDYLKLLASLRAEVLASRSITDFSRKRGNVDDDEEAELRAEKKRKMEEDKRKKAGISRGIKELSKVNVSGMQKLSEFFTKKPAAAAKAKA